MTALAIQASVQVSRDISTKTVNDLALKSQIDSNLICVDDRFRGFFTDNILAKQSAFRFRKDPSDFLTYAYLAPGDSITDCSSLIVYQSNYALIPEQFSDAKKRIQNVSLVQDISIKQYPLLVSN